MNGKDGNAYPTAGELAADLAGRRISALEAIERAIARIEHVDPSINAVVVRDFERARSAARSADAALARGERRPLLGVPITVKESFHVAGLATTWGMPWFRDWKATEDAVAVARLKAAGAVLIGKTNVPFALGDWQSYNDIYGTTNNPWALDRSPGGSSGGSAAALAAGYVPLEIGSDIAGSLRVPAHFCGVFSHKSSRGAIPGRGHVPPATSGGTADLAVVGPLATSASDLELAFDVLAGPDVIEAAAPRTPPPARHERLADFRVLALDTHPLLPAGRAMRGAVSDLVERLRARGTRVDVENALVPDLVAIGRAFVGLLMPVVSARMPPDAIAELQAAAANVPPDADSPAAWRARASVATHREWLAADAERTQAAYAWHALMREYDVVLMPPMPTPAFVQDQSDPDERTIEIDGASHPYGDQMFYAAIASALGLPATTAPIARSAEGLPIGIQIIGPYFEDRTTLRFAALLEREFGGFTPPPNLPPAR